jgi:hypothetical protein
MRFCSRTREQTCHIRTYAFDGPGTEAEARAWIAQDKRLDGADELSPEYQNAGASD